MSNFNTSSGFGFTSTEEGLYHSINLYSNANVTFSFQAPLAWQVSFYVLYGGPAPLPMTATYGTQTKTISANNQWQQVTLAPQGPGAMTLTLATQVLPAGAEIVISNLQIGLYPINLELWFANQNEPLTAWVDNLPDKNYALQVANQAMVATAGPTIGTSGFTIEMWLLPTGPGPIASFGVGPMSVNASVMLLQIGAGGSLSFQVAGRGGSDGGLVTTAGPTAMLDGEWHHVAAVRSATTLSLWLDGEQVASANAQAASLQQPYPIYLGYQWLTAQNELTGATYLTGAFDEVRLWKVARSQMQIEDGMHHQLSDQEPGLLGHWTFDGQNLNDSSPNKMNFSTEAVVSYVESPIDFEPEGEPYLITQAQLMQDYVATASTPAFREISGFRVVIAARDGNGNPVVPVTDGSGNVTQGIITIWVADPNATAALIFLDGSTATITGTNSTTRPLDPHGELSFVLDSGGQLVCPVLKVNADFMASNERLVISPDRHVHATLATLTGPQLSGAAPLPSGKQGALGNLASLPAAQLSGVASAISNIMATAVDHNLQPERPVTRKRDSPEDTALETPIVERYQALPTIVEPYHFASNTISAHYLSDDSPITRIVVAESMPNANWSLNMTSGAFTVTSPTVSPVQGRQAGAPADVTIQHFGALATLYNGQASISVTAGAYLTAAEADDDASSIQTHLEQRSAGSFWDKVKAAASVVVSTVEAAITGTTETIKNVVVRAIDAAGNIADMVLNTVEDAINFATSLLARLGAAILDIVHFIQAIFSWGDIVQTAVTINNVLSQVPAVLTTAFTQAQTKIDTALDSFQTYLDTQLAGQIAQLGPKPSFTSQTAKSKDSPPSDIQSNYVKSLYSANLKNAQDPALAATAPAGLGTAWHAQFNATSMAATQQAASSSTFFSFGASPDAFLGAALADLLSAIKTTVDAAITLMKTAVDGVFSFLTQVVNTIFALAQKRIVIPLVTDFYEQVVMQGQGTFSLLGLVSLLAAIPYTVIYKAATGSTSAPFTQQEAAAIQAPGWLNTIYQASPVNTALSAQGTAHAAAATMSAGSAAGLSGGIAARNVAPLTAMQKVSEAMNLTYMAGTALWGLTCVIEDIEALAKAPNQAPTPFDKFLYWAKMTTQTITDIAGFPLFTLPSNPSQETTGVALGLWYADILELASNFLVMDYVWWASTGDPLVTGLLGVGQLALSIWYTLSAGGTPARILLNLASNACAAYEWIPQLLKLDPEPDSREIALGFIPLLEGAAYGSVTLATFGGVVYGLQTGN